MHSRKEVENYLLHKAAIARAITKKSAERLDSGSAGFAEDRIEPLLLELTEGLKNKVQSQLVTARQAFERRIHPGTHPSNISEAAMNEFDAQWSVWAGRVKLVSGKEVLTMLNRYLQSVGLPALTPLSIIDAMQRSDVPREIVEIIDKIAEMKTTPLEEQLDYELS
ncbi:MAG TPA: hypothetical protein VEH04_14960 [Verrucomicrobiae bacterium]|nr:hypothetical protein [Verrucomicrobiae bacterium]